MSFATHYNPTPLEQAYTCYLLEQVLHVPLPTSSQEIQLPGRQAVPFLSSSGVNRSLLRDMWNFVDPDGEGRLLRTIQFTSLLKLVALAQSRLIGFVGSIEETAEGLLCHRQGMPLAQFAAVMIPEAGHLQRQYQAYITTLTLGTGPTEQLSIEDAFGDLIVEQAAPPQQPSWQMEQTKQFGSLQGAATVEANDEFGDMQDAAGGTPSFQVGPGVGTFQGEFSETMDGATATATIPVAPNNDADEFGGFEDVSSSAPLQSPTLQPGPTTTSLTAPTAEFGGLHDAVDVAPANVNINNDEFGGFNDAVGATNYTNNSTDPFGTLGPGVTTTNQTIPAPAETPAAATDNGGDSFAGFEDFTPAPTPSSNDPFGALASAAGPAVSVAPTTVEDVDDFGGFADAATSFPADSGVANNAADPFGALGPAENQPIPSLVAETPAAVVDDDDFGGFESVDPAPVNADNTVDPFGGLGPTQNQPMPSSVPPATNDDDGFGGFEDAAPVPAGSMDADPFGALGPAENQPMPPLIAETVAHDDDDFGGFEDAGPVPAPPPTDGNHTDPFGALGPAGNQPMPSLSVQSSATDDDDDFGGFENVHPAPVDAENTVDPFGALGPTENQPMPSLVTETSAPDDDSFGGFEDAAPVPLPLPTDGNHTDPFGALGPAENQPIPSSVLPVTDDDDDGFGGFEDATPAPAPAPIPADSIGADPFGALGPAENQPMPSLIAETPAVADDDDDDFGGFESVAPASPADNNTADPFGALEPAENQPMPSLSVQSSATDDDFGGFESVNPIPADAENTVDPFGALGPAENQPMPSSAPAIEDDDDFGGFEDASSALPANNNTADPSGILGPSENQPISSLSVQPSTTAADDDFGGFTDAIPVASLTGASDDDPFGAFGPAENRPMPSLVAEATNDGHDDFGGFEDAAPAPTPVPADNNNDADLFGALGPAQNQSMPSSVEEISGNDDDDEFGGFEDPAPAPVLADNEDPFEALGPAEKHNDTFGGFEDAAAATSAPVPEVSNFKDAAPVDSADPFEVLGPATNHPMPTLAPTPKPTVDNDDNDFGGFEGAPANNVDPFGELQTPATQVDDDFGGFSDGGLINETDQFGTSGPTENPSAARALASAIDNEFGGFEDAPEDSADPFSALEPTDNQPVLSSVHPPASDDDFGGFEDAAPPDGMDLFGTLATSDNLPLSQEAPRPAVDDDFGGFENAPAGSVDLFSTLQPPEKQSDPPSAAPAATDTDFGAFEGDPFHQKHSEMPGPVDSQGTVPNETTDLFSSTLDTAESTDNKPSQSSGDRTLNFGDFQDSTPHSNDATKTGAGIAQTNEDFGNFESPGVDDHGDKPDFGDFGVAAGSSAHPSSTMTSPHEDQDDDFGDFSSFNNDTPTSEPQSDQVNPAPSASEIDDFGDFAAFPTPAVNDFEKQHGGKPNDNFGNFGGMETPVGFADFGGASDTTTAFANFSEEPKKLVTTESSLSEGSHSFKSAPGAGGDSSSNWDAFKTAPSGSSDANKDAVTSSLDGIRAKSQALVGDLPQELLKRQDESVVNIMSVFDQRINSVGGSQALIECKRFYEVLAKISSSRSGQVQVWKKSLNIIRDELSRGVLLLEEAKNLSRDEISQVKPALSKFVAGLGEFVRVVRSIVATMGDILCLSTDTTFSRNEFETSWHSVRLLEIALQIEDSWSSIGLAAEGLGFHSISIDTVPSIRAECLAKSQTSSETCQLTLQPVDESLTGTKKRIEWDGRCFMACSANFYANRISAAFRM